MKLARYFLLSFTLFTTIQVTTIQAQSAQPESLAELLPAETFLALGIQDWASHREKLQPYVDEFTRLGLAEALLDIGGAAGDATTGDATTGDEASAGEGEDSSEPATPSEPAEDMTSDEFLAAWQERFGDTDLLEMFGQEAWIGVAATPSNPIPAGIFLTKLTPEVSEQFAALIAEENEKAQGLQTLTEGDFEFYVSEDTTENATVGLNVAAYALHGDTLMLTTNPDVLRGVLRQLGGSNDPSFTTGEGYTASLATFDAGNSYSYFNFPVLADFLAPLAKQAGFEGLVDRLVQAFDTLGVTAGVSRFTESGTETQGLQALNPAGGDATLLALLTESGSADRSVLDSAPTDALSVSSSYTNLVGWWDWLNEIAASQPELGGDLDTILQGFGLDLRSTLFSWAGPNLQSITTGVSETVEPGMAASNLLGEAVYLFAASDEAAAQEGLSTLVQTISTQIAAFADPSGGTGNAAETTEDIAGVPVTSFEVTDGVNLSYAVTDGYALLATSQDAMTKVLNVGEPFAQTPAVEALLADVPEDAMSFAITNDQALWQNSAEQISSSIQMAAGMGGASTLNFDNVEEASTKFEEFFAFVAERLGYSVTYSQQGEEGVTSVGKTEIAW
ncbi:MAG: hypothetical protein ACRCYY_08165 [Trueperaceae bacterium]